MTTKNPTPARLFVLLAREAPVGIILRRGPRDWVQMIHWDTEHDVFTPGQWFHGRLYSYRCDISPDGKMLIYFAAKYFRVSDPPDSYRIWTAISKPPYFTALYTRPDFDTYGGGGFFIDNQTVLENTTSPYTGVSKKLDELTIMSEGRIYSDQAIFFKTLEARGWKTDERSAYRKSGRFALSLNYTFIRHAKVTYSLHLGDVNHGTLKAVEWADFDQRGRLIVARQGKLFSAVVENGELNLTELADFNANQPQPLEAPEWAKQW